MEIHTHNVTVVADVKRAFLQLGLHERSQDVTRSLRMKNLNKDVQKDNLKIYGFKWAAFGVISSHLLFTLSNIIVPSER